MATSLQDAPPRHCGVIRTWFPVFVLPLGAFAVMLIRLLMSDETADVYKTMGVFIAGGLAIVSSLVWLLFFAPWPLSVRLPVFTVLVGLPPLLLTFNDRGGWGSIWPQLSWRWTSPDDALEKHRKQTAGDLAPLPGKSNDEDPTAFPEFRGRRRDGVVHGPALARDWTTAPPRQLWRQPVGAGHSAFAIAGPLAITQEQRRDNEAIVCYDTATGKERWLYPYPALFHETLGGKGPRATPTIAGSAVYSLGATGKLVCLDARTGAHQWTVDVLADNENIKWGMSGSPLVVGDLVVVNPGTQTEKAAGVLTAYHCKTGARAWASDGRAYAGYSSPMLATLSGKQQILLFDGEGLSGYDPKDGKQLWRHPWATQEHINSAQPLVLGEDRVFLSSGYSVGCALLEVKESGGRWAVRELWKNRNMRCRFYSPVLHEGHVYGLDEGVLTCLDAQTGQRTWRGARYGHGQLLLTNGLLLVLSEEGELALVEAAPAAYRELTRFQAIEGRTWNVPALADGRVYLRNGTEMACYDLTGR